MSGCIERIQIKALLESYLDDVCADLPHTIHTNCDILKIIPRVGPCRALKEIGRTLSYTVYVGHSEAIKNEYIGEKNDKL